MTAYWELLKDPRWQRKRLEIMQRDGFKCYECEDAETTLNVHHRRYVKGRKPWEYEDSDLVTLCETCHEKVEANLAELHELIGTLNFISRPLAIGFLKALARDGIDQGMLDDAIPVRDLFELNGLAMYFRMSRDELMEIAGLPSMQNPLAVRDWLQSNNAVSFKALYEAAFSPTAGAS